MKCLELYINGKLVCIIGREDVDNYHANIIQWRSKNKVEVSAGGGTGIQDDVSETFSWGSQFIDAGDEVLVRVVDDGKPDKPIEITKHDYRDAMNEMESNIAEMMAKLRLKMEVEGEEAIFNKTEENDEYCSFCGKAKDEVSKMISGPSVFICSECVTVCDDIIAGKHPDESPPNWPERKD